MATKDERRARKIKLRREHKQASNAAKRAEQRVGEQPSAAEPAAAGPSSGYPHCIPKMAHAGDDDDDDSDMSDSDDDINDNYGQEFCQDIQAAGSGQTDEMAIWGPSFQFDLQDAFNKLTIAAKHPSDENMEALESTFENLTQLTQIMLSKKHTPEEAAILIAAGMRSTKMSIDIDMQEHKEGIRKVHVSHFSHIKEIFRRLSVVEGRRQALPPFVQDPKQPLPDVAILKELDGMQESLHALQRREDLTPYFKQLRAQFDKFSTESRQQLKRQHSTMRDMGNEMERIRTQLKKKDERLDMLEAEMAEVRALLVERGGF